LRVKQGELLQVHVRNKLDEPTLVHWHGISLINSMDGTRLTQPLIDPGTDFRYAFVVPDAGTHWYHAHYGDQLDRGLYAPLIVEPQNESLSYDKEFTLILDDWKDGIESERKAAAAKGGRLTGYGDYRKRIKEHTNHKNQGKQRISFGGTPYPLMLINAKAAADPDVFRVRRGDRIRLRIINAAADTGFRFAVAGHRLTVTHSDGMPVEQVVVDNIRLGMGERYDVLIDADSPGTWQIAAKPEGKKGLARALLQYADVKAINPPPQSFEPTELKKKLLTYDDLVSTTKSEVPLTGQPDRVYNMTLRHTKIEVDGLASREPIMVKEGEWHPMHLHGHHFQLGNSGRAMKDTVSVPAKGGQSTWDWRADNPGKWMMHCHNLSHMEDGMMRVIKYG